MSMLARLRAKATDRLNIKKASVFAIVINAVQIFVIAAFCVYLLFDPSFFRDANLTRPGILLVSALACWGALVDIREAVAARKNLAQVEDMELTLRNMETLNNTLRAQRHDFLNHLQVVFSLMEMEEYKEAQDYIETVYGDIASLSRVMKTANPAVNALLQVKLAVCEKKGIPVEMEIKSAWRHLPVPGWEMCKVLSNLIDNAIDAMEGQKAPRLRLYLGEDVRSFRFSVSNTGPMIPQEMQSRIFLPGVTTKAQGHGMGLFIVRQTLTDRGGDITVASTPGETCFAGWLPKGTLTNSSQKTADTLQKDN